MILKRRIDTAKTNPGVSCDSAQVRLEKRLLGVWSSVVGCGSLRVTDNLLETDVDSLDIVEVLEEIERQFGVVVPVSALHHVRTIRELAAVVNSIDTEHPADTMVALQPDGGLTPLFCIPGIGGHCLAFRPLASRLAPRQPVYGLDYPGLDGRSEPCRTIEELAASFVGPIQKARPGGPCKLLGYSFGGLIAFEMARQLTAAGRRIENVVLADTYIPCEIRVHPLHKRVVAHVRRLAQLKASEQLRYFINGVRRLVAREVPNIETATLGSMHGDSRSTLATRLRNVERACLNAAVAYRPGLYSGPVTLLRVAETQWADLGVAPPSYGWPKYCNSFQERQIECEHLDMFNPQAMQFMVDCIIGVDPRRGAS